MNETLRLLRDHRSDRSFSEAPIDDAALDAIVEAAQRAPSSRNAQQTSVIVVRNPETRRAIWDITHRRQTHVLHAPVFILVIADFYKTSVGVEKAGAEQIVHRSVEGYTVGAVDAGIILASISIAARSLGLGAVVVGAVRDNPKPLIELLKLPPLTFPIAGVSIGYVKVPATPKPRLPLAAFRHDEQYRAEELPTAIAEYDRQLVSHWEAVGRSNGVSWTQNLLPYSRPLHPETKVVANLQGFTFTQ